MKTIWTVASVLAVAHLLALLGFVGWLVGSDRLDGARVERLRGMLSETVGAERARLEAEAEEAARLAAEHPPEPAGFAMPVSAAAMVEERLALEDAGEGELRRLRDQLDALRAALAVEREQVDAQRAALEAERVAFQDMRGEIERVEGDEQFRKSLGVLQGMKAEDAATLLRELIAGGGPLAGTGAVEGGVAVAGGRGDIDAPTSADAAPSGMLRAVAYLDQMSSRARTKIMSELAEGDPGLATELLERLRTHGVMTRAAEDSGG